MTYDRDPERCVHCDDRDEDDDLVATPEGPLCQDHADELV